MWQGWSCGLVHCPGGNATEQIWRVLASSLGISSWTPLKSQHSNPKPNPNHLANQLWCIDFLTLPTPLLSLTDFLPFLNLLCHSKTDARFMQDAPKAVWSILYFSVAFFPSLKQNFIAYRSSKVSDWIFEIRQLWQSGFSRVYSNSFCSCSFKPEIIKIGQSSHKMYSNNIVNFQESTTILNAHTKKSLETYRMPLVYLFKAWIIFVLVKYNLFMNDSTMNFIRHHFESSIAIYLVVCEIFSIKFSWFRAQEVLIFLGLFCYSEHFLRKR